MIAICSESIGIPLLEHSPACGIHHITRFPFRPFQLPNGLLCKNRFKTAARYRAKVAGVGDPKAITAAQRIL